MTGYDARTGVMATVEMINALQLSLTTHINTPVTTFGDVRKTSSDWVLPGDSSAIVVNDYEIGNPFVTELAGPDSVLEITL